MLSPVSKIWSVQYELKINDRLSFNNTLFYRKQSSIPFADELDKVAKSRGLGITGVDFTYIFIDKSQIGIKGYSPELRYYFKSKKHPWFIGGFAQFEQFDMTVPASFLVRYDGSIANVELPVDFDISTTSGGILIGKKFVFNRVSLDVVLVGPHFGSAKKVDAQINEPLLNRLSDADQEFLRQGVIERFKLDESYFNVGVLGEQARINAKQKVPYFGIRGLGFNLGYSF
ncbi:hypothetical protein SAMN06298216_3456 [Spirosomataceae bacterium TFI 002]|nr:hypothetical protein SAMN06298216_3456 [Spirosomataceae bacterium TFI 002]